MPFPGVSSSIAPQRQVTAIARGVSAARRRGRPPLVRNPLPVGASLAPGPGALLVSDAGRHGTPAAAVIRSRTAGGGTSMRTPSFSDLPDVDSELFEQVTDDELALLEYYRALPAERRATVLEALVRTVEQARETRRDAGTRTPPAASRREGL